MKLFLKLFSFLLFWLVFIGKSNAQFSIEILSPDPVQKHELEDSILVVAFQIKPAGNYGIEVINHLPNSITLEQEKIRFEKGIYLCDVPLELGRNALKIIVFPATHPEKLKLESLDVYRVPPKAMTEKLITDTVKVLQLDTIQVLQVDTVELLKTDTLEIFKTDTFSIAENTNVPEIILHRPHPLDDPVRGKYFIAHERQMDIRFSIAPFSENDVFENWIFDPVNPTSALKAKQRDNTFFGNLKLNKKENRVTISVHNITKDIQLEKSIDILYEPRNFVRQGKDYALFIAVEEYQPGWMKLQNPVTDVQAIGKMLEEKYRFETSYLYNPTGEAIETAIRQYVQKEYQPHDQLLIFLSGHGVYDKLFENGYFAPADANAYEKTRRSYYSYKELKNQISKMGCNKILLMIDACYSGAFFDVPLNPIYKSGPKPLEQQKEERIYFEMEKKTFKALTSADRQTTTYDNWNGLIHSPFTDQILKTLASRDPDGIIDLNDLLAGIKGLGSIGQLPVLHSFAPLLESPGADFYFIQKK